MQTIKEQRLWLTHNGSLLMSGKPDLVVIDGDRALVIDYKTGYLETLEASQNLQLRTLAVMVAANHDVDEVSVAIVQPNIRPGYSIARYDEIDLEVAERQLRKILDDANDENAVANPAKSNADIARPSRCAKRHKRHHSR